MKRLFAFFTILFFGISFGQVNSVVVNGKTNLTSFKCVNDKFNAESKNYSFKNGKLPHLQIEVDYFDCKNKMMNRDMKKTLMADKYPKMYVKFLSIEKISDKKFTAHIEVKLTGKVRYYITQFNVSNNTVVGNEKVRFSDFGLTPPSKMGKMVVVNDVLDLVLVLAY